VTRVAAAFVGCKVNQADSDEALARLCASGLSPSGRDDADIVVVHTCCVTAEAERKSRQVARREARAGRRVVVAGCAAALHPEQFLEPGLELLGARSWDEVAEGCGAAGAEAPSAAGSSDVAGKRVAGRATGTRTRVPGTRSRLPSARTRAVIKVQDGCAGNCTYCAVRLARGLPRSRPLDETLAAVDAAIRAGSGEVVLSGIDLGAWRDGGLRLADLVEAITASPAFAGAGGGSLPAAAANAGPAGAVVAGPARLRLSSIEPRDVDERLVAALAHERVARHLHVPLQSADDEVLAAMGRPYTYAEFERRVALARRSLGRAMLSTDVIVGFPTEDEAAFARTLAAIEGGGFGRVHVFAFSPRPGTEAAELPPLPPAAIKARKARALAAAGAAARRARLDAVGRRAHVLIEDRHDGLSRGYSSEYIRYYVSGTARSGQLVGAVADAEHRDGVRGRIV